MSTKQRILNDVLSCIGEKHLKLLRKWEVIIAGGAITSAFTYSKINDIDCYFKSKECLVGFLNDVSKESKLFKYEVVAFRHFTDKATLVWDFDTEQDVQYVYQKYYKTTQDIFDNFDFTINMGAIKLGKTPEEDKVVLHQDFERHCLSRKLVVNTKSQYPLVSMFRAGKYKERGYSLDNKEMLKMLLMVNNLEINSWEQVKEHFSGFYGSIIQTYDERDIVFSKDAVLECVNESFIGSEGDLYINIGGLDVDDYSTAPYDFEELIKWLDNQTIHRGVEIYTSLPT